MEARAICFVVTGFEDIGDMKVGRNALNGVRKAPSMTFRFQNTGPGDKEKSAAANGYGADVEGVAHADQYRAKKQVISAICLKLRAVGSGRKARGGYHPYSHGAQVARGWEASVQPGTVG